MSRGPLQHGTMRREAQSAAPTERLHRIGPTSLEGTETNARLIERFSATC